MALSARLVLLALALATMGGAQGRSLMACNPAACKSQAGTDWHSTTIASPSLACDAVQNECCPACAKVWQPYVQPNYQTSPQVEFVYTGHGHGTAAASGPSNVAAHDHVLVMPNSPCRGVEDWHEPQRCHYEYVWDAAWAPIAAAGLQQKKAMAINSQHYRTQHQMHVHVADIQRGLGDWLQTLDPDGVTWYKNDCSAGGTAAATLKCNSPASGGNTHAVCKKVGPGAGPSAAAPFEAAYTKSYSPAAASKRGTLVYSPSADVFCVVTVQDRPVECLLYCGSECAGKIGAGCP